MSDNNTTINMQPVLDLQSLHKQLNSQKFKINVNIDTSALNSQIQASIGQFTPNMQPTKIRTSCPEIAGTLQNPKKY